MGLGHCLLDFFVKIMEVKTKKITRVDSKNSLTVGTKYGFQLFGSNKLTLLKLIESDIEKGKKIWIATVNPEFVMAALKDGHFGEILRTKTTYNVIDGIGLIWGLKTKSFLSGLKVGIEILRGGHRENLITGADLMDDLCAMAQKNNKSVYFFGGWKDRSKKTAKYFAKKYPKLKIAGFKAENFDLNIKADFLFVARGMKRQEEWIEERFDKLKVGLVMGVGRSFDYYSGDLPRAPKWVQQIGFEWLFSLFVEPKRWKRQLELPKFVWMVLKSP